MSEQREVINPATGQSSSVAAALAREPEEVKELRAAKKARLARVLERGIVVDRLRVELPDNLYGEWIPNDKLAIAEMNALGFDVDTQYAKKSSLHDDKDGGAVVGDTIFMVCERETKELIDEIRAEQFEKTHGKHGKGRQREEQEFRAAAEQTGLPIVEESRSRTARREELRDALEKAHETGKPTSKTVIK